MVPSMIMALNSRAPDSLWLSLNRINAAPARLIQTGRARSGGAFAVGAAPRSTPSDGSVVGADCQGGWTVWCGREDSNFHGLAATTTSTLRVYQFRHDRTQSARERIRLASPPSVGARH